MFWWARRARTRGVPLWACLSIYPKTRVCLFYCFMTFTNSSDINEGLSPTTFSLKEINLELWLISLLGIIGVFKSKPLRWLSNLPDRFTRTPTAMHRIVYSLPTMRGMGSLRYSNSIEPLVELGIIISWLQSPSAVILEPPKIKSDTVSTVSPSISHEAMGPDAMIFIF